MAKSSRSSVSSGTGVAQTRLRSLCTAAERKLLEMSENSGLSKVAHAEVQALLARAREARDKWRGLVGQQTRVVKRAPKAVAEANARSRDKADLFDGAVKRFEAHLKTLASTVTTAAQSATKSLGARVKKPKRARVAGNRTSRAGLRAELSRQVATLNRVVVKPAAAKAKSLVAAVTATKAPAASAKVAAAPLAGKAAAKSKKRKLPPAKAAAAAQAIRFDATKQRSARTAAKNSRLKMEGLATRRGSHVMAAGKRAQARRDKRR